jgi:hypothetical protein
MKMAVYKTIIRPAILYASATWTRTLAAVDNTRGPEINKYVLRSVEEAREIRWPTRPS